MILDERITLNEADAPNIPEVDELIKQNKWQDAYDYPNSQEGMQKYPNVSSKEVQDYVVDRLANSTNFTCVQDDAKGILKKLLVEMGLEIRTNPYIEYFTNMSKKGNNGLFTKENMIALNNLLADNDISEDELTNNVPLDISKEDDSRGLLYEPSLFKGKTASDTMNIVNEYKSFEKNYLNKLPYDLVGEDGEPFKNKNGEPYSYEEIMGWKEDLKWNTFMNENDEFKSWSDIKKSLDDIKHLINIQGKGESKQPSTVKISQSDLKKLNNDELEYLRDSLMNLMKERNLI